MKLGKQIKKYRNNLSLSQEQLAERVFVSRQTISNWENDKNYPDIKSLLLLSEVFEVSFDDLVKGDLEEMKKQINSEDVNKLKRLSAVLTIGFVVIILTPIPLTRFFGWVGGIIWAILYAMTMFVAVKTDRFKKQHDIQTYREIEAFMNGESIDKIEKVQETAKRPYQKILACVGMGLLAFVVCLIMSIIIY